MYERILGINDPDGTLTVHLGDCGGLGSVFFPFRQPKKIVLQQSSTRSPIVEEVNS